MSFSDPLKDAFSKVKQDIDELKYAFQYLNQQIEDIKRTLEQLNPTENLQNQANQQINPTIQQMPSDYLPSQALKQPNTPISTGNWGVPTDSQADSQTNQQAEKNIDHYKFHSEESPELSESFPKIDQISQIQRVSQVLDSLDSIKKEIRSNFKQLTSQEMNVFSAIYTLEEQGFVVDYPLISQKLGLSESSIRDYCHKLTKKGVPIIKSKENNKKITLKISPDLKKIASLQTILALRKL